MWNALEKTINSFLWRNYFLTPQILCFRTGRLCAYRDWPLNRGTFVRRSKMRITVIESWISRCWVFEHWTKVIYTAVLLISHIVLLCKELGGLSVERQALYHMWEQQFRDDWIWYMKVAMWKFGVEKSSPLQLEGSEKT